MKKHEPTSTLLHKLHSDINDEALLTRDLSAIVASRIQEILNQKGLSHKDLAQATRHTQGVVSRWLSGKHNFTLSTIAKISVALNQNILEL